MTQNEVTTTHRGEKGWPLIRLKIHSSNTLMEELGVHGNVLQQRLTEAACCHMDDTYVSHEWSHFTEVASFLCCDRTASSSSLILVDEICFFFFFGCAINQPRIDVEGVDPNFVMAALICTPYAKRIVGECEGTIHTYLPLVLPHTSAHSPGASPGPHKGVGPGGTGKHVLAKASTMLTRTPLFLNKAYSDKVTK